MSCSHIFVGSNYCRRCGVHADACNAQELPGLRLFRAAARKLLGGRRDGPEDDGPRQPLSPEGLRHALDVLMAEYVVANPDKGVSKTSLLEFAEWAGKRFQAAAAAQASGGPAS